MKIFKYNDRESIMVYGDCVRHVEYSNVYTMQYDLFISIYNSIMDPTSFGVIGYWRTYPIINLPHVNEIRIGCKKYTKELIINIYNSIKK